MPDVRVIGGPTTVIELGGLRLITDPTFDGPGDYTLANGARLTKTAPAPTTADEAGPFDVALVSHDEHADNLDDSGRALLTDVPHVFTTHGGAQRLSVGTHGLAPWESAEVPRPDGGTLTVTGVPARHGPEGCEPITGEVIGFVLTATDLPTVYVSGDNAALELVREIAERTGPIDTAVLFAGAVRDPNLFDGALLTLDSAQAAEAAQMLQARQVVVAHTDSWAHFTESWEDVVKAFAAAGLTDRLQAR